MCRACSKLSTARQKNYLFVKLFSTARNDHRNEMGKTDAIFGWLPCQCACLTEHVNYNYCLASVFEL